MEHTWFDDTIGTGAEDYCKGFFLNKAATPQKKYFEPITATVPRFEGRNVVIDSPSGQSGEKLTSVESRADQHLLHLRISSLSQEVRELKTVIASLVERIEGASNKEILDEGDVSDGLEIVDEVVGFTLEDAKEQIALYFREHDGVEISYSELMENLKIDLDLIIDACSELENEGKIG